MRSSRAISSWMTPVTSLGVGMRANKLVARLANMNMVGERTTLMSSAEQSMTQTAQTNNGLVKLTEGERFLGDKE